jgi:hypothetical protein
VKAVQSCSKLFKAVQSCSSCSLIHANASTVPIRSIPSNPVLKIVDADPPNRHQSTSRAFADARDD